MSDPAPSDDALTVARTELHRELFAFARRARHDEDDGVFEDLAARVLAYQARAVPAYGRLVQSLGRDPATLRWHDAPLVPTELFRELDLCSLPVSPKDRFFRTSGTTAGKRGFRRVPDLALYRAAMSAPFIEHVLKPLGGAAQRRRWISLIPRADTLPDSSLSFMVTELAEVLSSERYWIVEPEGLRLAEARIALGEGHGDGGEPVVVLTTPFALAELLDKARWFPRLPPGSVVMLTGGFKGKRDDLSEDALLERLESVLGVPPSAVVPEYGMTELTSQAYGRPFTPMASLRFRIVHPETGAPCAPGEVGLVGCFDLLNLDHVSAILTSDLGSLDEHGRLSLHGRQPGAVPRGCSLSAEELLAGAPGLATDRP